MARLKNGNSTTGAGSRSAGRSNGTSGMRSDQSLSELEDLKSITGYWRLDANDVRQDFLDTVPQREANYLSGGSYFTRDDIWFVANASAPIVSFDSPSQKAGAARTLQLNIRDGISRIEAGLAEGKSMDFLAAREFRRRRGHLHSK